MIQEIFAFQSESEYEKLQEEIKDLRVFLKDAIRSKDLFCAYSYAIEILDRIESCFKKIEKIKVLKEEK